MKLYVINSPSFMQNHVSHTNGDTLTPIEDPLSEHFTFMYYNFIKYGLVDEVIIFPRDGQHRDHKGDFPYEINVDGSKKIIINWQKNKEMYDFVNKTKDDYVFVYNMAIDYPDCKMLKDKFVIFNPMFNNVLYEDKLNPKHHHFGLIEGKAYEKSVTNNIPFSVYHLISRAFSDINIETIRNTEKKYDWIMVSSFDPRKRHVEFLKNLVKNPLFGETKGCIVGRDPANKGRITNHTRVFETVKSIVSDCNNIDMHINTTLQEKIELMLSSKIFVCVSSLDNGPRAMVEAAQCAMPMLSMPHIGSSDLILPGQTGARANTIPEACNKLYDMVETFNKGGYQDTYKILQLLKPENIFPRLINHIQNVKKTNKYKHR